MVVLAANYLLGRSYERDDGEPKTLFLKAKRRAWRRVYRHGNLSLVTQESGTVARTASPFFWQQKKGCPLFPAFNGAPGIDLPGNLRCRPTRRHQEPQNLRKGLRQLQRGIQLSRTGEGVAQLWPRPTY